MFTIKQQNNKYIYGIKIGPTELVCHEDSIDDFENQFFPIGGTKCQSNEDSCGIYVCTQKTDEIQYFIDEIKRHRSNPKAYIANPYATFPRSVTMQFIQNGTKKNCVTYINGMSFSLSNDVLKDFNTTEFNYDQDGLRVRIKDNKFTVECIYNEMVDGDVPLCKYYTQNDIAITNDFKKYLEEMKKFMETDDYIPMDLDIQLIKC